MTEWVLMRAVIFVFILRIYVFKLMYQFELLGCGNHYHIFLVIDGKLPGWYFIVKYHQTNIALLRPTWCLRLF